MSGSASDDRTAAVPAGLYERTKKLVAACTVDRSYDVPYLANRSKDGKTVYIDNDLPAKLKCGADLAKTLPWHELAEWALMNDGWAYDEPGKRDAHPVANAIEKRAVEALGVSWAAYSKELDPYIKRVSDESIRRVPPDLDLRPYKDEKDRKVLRELQQARKRMAYRLFKDVVAGDAHVSTALGNGRKRRARPFKATIGEVKDAQVAKLLTTVLQAGTLQELHDLAHELCEETVALGAICPDRPRVVASSKRDDGEDFEIRKVNEHKQYVFGWANVAVTKDGNQIEDRQGDIIDTPDLEEGAYRFVLKHRETGEMHEGDAKGSMIESTVFTPEKLDAMGLAPDALPAGWWIGFHVPDADVFAKVLDGTYSMFSIQGQATREAA